jgi:hypothetical protein
MKPVRSLRSDMAYVKQLVGAGFDGIAAARLETAGRIFVPPLQTVVWTPAAIGATMGALSTRMIAKNKSASGVAVGGLIGSVFGFGAALAWSSRHFTRPAARHTIRRVNAARDAHWLESHPIDYA